MDEGYIKYTSEWIKSGPLPEKELESLNKYRQQLYELGLIGAYENGIGFGNISRRWWENQFIISGSATGNLEHLTADHYTLVEDFDLSQNQLTCRGPIQASSESMSHGVIYQTSNRINAVIHVHSADLWKRLLHRVPTTGKDITYGTPEMALEIIRLFHETNLNEQKVFVMEGHQDGIFAFGRSLEEAMEALLNC